MVFLRVSEAYLAQALRARLREFDFCEGETPPAAAMCLTTAQDTTPSECKGLRAGGGGVVVLSSVDRQHEREAYHRAGAHYLEMSMDVLPLMRLLRQSAAASA